MHKVNLELPACFTIPASYGDLSFAENGVGIRKAEVFTWKRDGDEYAVSFTLGIPGEDDDPSLMSFMLSSQNHRTEPFVIDVTSGNASLNGFRVFCQDPDVYVTVFIRELGSNPTLYPMQATGYEEYE